MKMYGGVEVQYHAPSTLLIDAILQTAALSLGKGPPYELDRTGSCAGPRCSRVDQDILLPLPLPLPG